MIYSVFWRIDDSGFKNLEELYRRSIYAVRMAVSRFSFAAAGFDYAMPSYGSLRGERISEVIGCHGRSVVGERLGAKNLTTRNSAERLVASAISTRTDPRFMDIVNLSCFTDYSVIY